MVIRGVDDLDKAKIQRHCWICLLIFVHPTPGICCELRWNNSRSNFRALNVYAIDPMPIRALIPSCPQAYPQPFAPSFE